MLHFENVPWATFEDWCMDCNSPIWPLHNRWVSEMQSKGTDNQLVFERHIVGDCCVWKYGIFENLPFQKPRVITILPHGKEKSDCESKVQANAPTGNRKSDDTGVYMPTPGEWNPTETVAEDIHSRVQVARSARKIPFF